MFSLRVNAHAFLFMLITGLTLPSLPFPSLPSLPFLPFPNLLRPSFYSSIEPSHI